MDDSFIGARGASVEDVEQWIRHLDLVAASLGWDAQAVDAGVVCGRVHLESALLHARRAFVQGENLARRLEVEWVLCVAGVRQVSVALERVGVRSGLQEFAIMLLGREGPATEEGIAELLAALELERDDGLLDCSEASLRRLGVTDAEMAMVPRGRWPDLALERVALLELER